MINISNIDLSEELLSLGEYALQKDMVDDAIKYFSDAIELNHHLAAAYNNLGVIFWGKNDFANALNYIKTATQKDPACLDYTLNYADMLTHLENFPEAVKSYNEIKRIFGSVLAEDEVKYIDGKLSEIKEAIGDSMPELIAKEDKV